MRRYRKILIVLSGVLVVALIGLFAAGFRVFRDPASGRVLLVRKALYKPQGGNPNPGGPLRSIELLTPDPIILENMAMDEFLSYGDGIVKAAERALSEGGGAVKLSLTVTFHPDRETDNLVVVESGDTEAAQRLADAADEADKAVRTKVGDVSVRFHFEKKGKTLVIAPKAPVGPGEPVPGTEDERDVMAAVAALARPPGAVPPEWTSVICGPAFWKSLRGLDPALEGRGMPTTALTDGVALEARTFLQKNDALTALTKSPGFQALMGRFASGTARAATRQEREAIYSKIAFEIKGQPVTVIEDDGDVLFVSASKGLLWLDLVSGASAEAPKTPAAFEADPQEKREVERALLSACAAEAGMFCNAAGEDFKAVKRCLLENKEKLLPRCAKAFR